LPWAGRYHFGAIRARAVVFTVNNTEPVAQTVKKNGNGVYFEIKVDGREKPLHKKISLEGSTYFLEVDAQGKDLNRPSKTVPAELVCEYVGAFIRREEARGGGNQKPEVIGEAEKNLDAAADQLAELGSFPHDARSGICFFGTVGKKSVQFSVPHADSVTINVKRNKRVLYFEVTAPEWTVPVYRRVFREAGYFFYEVDENGQRQNEDEPDDNPKNRILLGRRCRLRFLCPWRGACRMRRRWRRCRATE